jgi:hypothetical protein
MSSGPTVKAGSGVGPAGDPAYIFPVTAKVIIANSVGDNTAPNAIVIPRFAGDPDAEWSPMGVFDDHFDGSSLNSKWTLTQGLPNSPLAELQGSCFNISGRASSGTAFVYSGIAQSLPNSNPFTITGKIETVVLPMGTGLASGQTSASFVQIGLTNAAGNNGVQIRIYGAYPYATPPSSYLFVNYGVLTGSPGSYALGVGSPPKYYKIVFDSSFGTTIYFSANGRSWMNFGLTTGANSGFSGSNLPTTFLLQIGCSIYAYAQGCFDWVKFTNP